MRFFRQLKKEKKSVCLESVEVYDFYNCGAHKNRILFGMFFFIFLFSLPLLPITVWRPLLTEKYTTTHASYMGWTGVTTHVLIIIHHAEMKTTTND